MEPNWRLVPLLEVNRDAPTENVDYMEQRRHSHGLKGLPKHARIRCQACSGFDHSSRDCPTQSKLNDLASVGGPHAEVLARAGRMAEEGMAQRLVQSSPPGSVCLVSPTRCLRFG